MQSSAHRWLILIVLVTLSALLQAASDHPVEQGSPRWPTEDTLYQVSDWTIGPLTVERESRAQYIIRTYDRSDGTHATLAISTSLMAKVIYRAGADVPFLGDGYTSTPAPPSMIPRVPVSGALLVRRGEESALLIHTTGERRGLLGGGALGWGMVVLDALFGRPNEYYMLRILVPLDRLDSPAATEAVRLAETLFPRLAAWYAN